MTAPQDVPAPSPTVSEAMREAMFRVGADALRPVSTGGWSTHAKAELVIDAICPLIASALAALERENATLRAERDEATARAREPIGDTWDQIRHLEGECRVFIRERNEWKAVADTAEAELATLRADAERMEAARPKVWVITNNERGADRRYRMWSGRAWVWTPDVAQAAHFARRADANQILPDGSPYDYADRIAALNPKETPDA
ncbi:hypothetical protein [Methylobacterium flocculans]|uniref:hypothetical protein n=1 Tax=Methylobacterium flocculans TaxID=2984843 RepID=UPI0021F2BB26|nr:hypothetical protein [Methylobacterium sp. FF17]